MPSCNTWFAIFHAPSQRKLQFQRTDHIAQCTTTGFVFADNNKRDSFCYNEKFAAGHLEPGAGLALLPATCHVNFMQHGLADARSCQQVSEQQLFGYHADATF